MEPEMQSKYRSSLNNMNLQKIILIRHGESEKDKNKPLRGITPRGKYQMEKTAKNIHSLVRSKSCEIISTKTIRTKQSAEILSGVIQVPFQISGNNLRVENIKSLSININSKKDLTFHYFDKYRKALLPAKIPPPTTIAKRFLRVVKKFKKAEVLIIVGHSGALEAFALYQDVFKPQKQIQKELNYGEFIVLTRTK